MASLTEVYEGGNGASLRRLYAGVALFGVGAVLLVAGIVTVATGVGSRFGLAGFEARRVAGILGGIGLPAVLLGTMAVLPRASRTVRAAAYGGAAVSLVGVYLFDGAYPSDWVGGSGDTSMTLVVASVYFLGTLVMTWCLFVAVANFKTRNDPGGTVRLEIMKDGETRIVEVSNDRLRGKLGGIGMLGGTPDGDVDTQTNRGASTDSRTTNRSSGGRGGSAATSQGVTDGGATTDDAEFLTPDSGEPTGDAYCGNCSHFQYVRSDGDIEPYCGYHGELMDDMDACGEWTSNTGR
jgi:hypothetical protein